MFLQLCAEQDPVFGADCGAAAVFFFFLKKKKPHFSFPFDLLLTFVLCDVGLFLVAQSLH